jgi:hypothetical protein
MRYETLFIMVRVEVYADHTSVAELVKELETESKFSLSDTANINVMETEILLSTSRNEKNINHTP